ncbi:hypothetical protein HOK51_02715 [Candidatus Woesearchaeota archaeon]|jgi:hypothetical protein|nr:hypothetical protein [Candidatus Woesearchaeota archaeon]MBT6518730.1 hypothetical protein [Candidatus Woesearchaeota archaeon]MBT7367901.1 hypothetical protein [Candidatus Woesearchaeota archaeon]
MVCGPHQGVLNSIATGYSRVFAESYSAQEKLKTSFQAATIANAIYKEQEDQQAEYNMTQDRVYEANQETKQQYAPQDTYLSTGVQIKLVNSSPAKSNVENNTHVSSEDQTKFEGIESKLSKSQPITINIPTADPSNYNWEYNPHSTQSDTQITDGDSRSDLSKRIQVELNKIKGTDSSTNNQETRLRLRQQIRDEMTVENLLPYHAN